MTLLDEIDPGDMVDLEAGEWRPVPNEPAPECTHKWRWIDTRDVMVCIHCHLVEDVD